MDTFLGYEREAGRPGIRNHVAVVSVVASVNAITRRIAHGAGVEPILHDHDEYWVRPERDMVERALSGIVNHPNAGAVVLVGIERKPVEDLAGAVVGRPVEIVTLEGGHGAKAAVEDGIGKARALKKKLGAAARVELPVSHLAVGLKCGGSDTFSGMSCNPGLGEACDILVDQGGTAVLTETSGIYGAEYILAERAVNDDVARRIYEIVDRMETEATRLGKSLADGNPSPGNIAGGLTTLAEKCLGTIKKCGSRPVQTVIEFGETIRDAGVVIMDTPGLDVYSVSGPVAGGAQIIAFTTGRGSPLGAPLSPVQKICGNPETFVRLQQNMDVNAGTVITGEQTLDQVGEKIYRQWIDIANGVKTKAEQWGHREFALPRAGSTL